MDENELAGMIEAERSRMTAFRETIVAQRDELANKLALFNRELASIDAYLAGAMPTAMASVAPSPRASTGNRGGRKGGKQEGIKAVLAANPGGLTRGEIIAKMGISKGDKSGENSVSNALTSMKKAGLLANDAGKYTMTVH